MNNILIKCGIVPEMLTQSQNEIFSSAVRDAKSKNFTPFDSFLDAVNKNAELVSNNELALKQKCVSALRSALKSIEKISQSFTRSTLSAFETPNGNSNFGMEHVAFITEICKAISDLENLNSDCAEIISKADDSLLVEFKLRCSALTEFAKTSQAAEKFRKTEASLKELSREAVIKKFSGCAVYIEGALSELKKLCEDTDTAFMKIQKDLESKAAYNRVIMRYAGIINNILANLA